VTYYTVWTFDSDSAPTSLGCGASTLKHVLSQMGYHAEFVRWA